MGRIKKIEINYKEKEEIVDLDDERIYLLENNASGKKRLLFVACTDSIMINSDGELCTGNTDGIMNNEKVIADVTEKICICLEE